MYGGGDNGNTGYTPYLVADCSMSQANSEYFALFYVASVQNFKVATDDIGLAGSDPWGGVDWADVGNMGIRPVVELPPNILVEEQSGEMNIINKGNQSGKTIHYAGKIATNEMAEKLTANRL